MTKRCYGCKKDLDPDQFYRNSARRDGLQDECKACVKERNTANYTKNAVKHNASTTKWRKDNPEKRREMDRRYTLKRKFRMTYEEFERLVNDSNGECAICRKYIGKSLCVDHDHATGIIRGLLCSACNLGLGYFKDNQDLLDSARKYLAATT